MRTRLLCLGLGVFLIAGVLGCASTSRHEQRRETAAEPVPRAKSEGLSGDQAGNMAADDVDSLKLKPAEPQQRSQRPPEPSRRRAVDQPRVR